MNSSKFLFLLILLSFIACDKGSSKKEKTESVKVLRPDTVTENNEKSKVKKPVEIKKESESNQQNSNLELSVDCTYPQKMAEQGLVNISEIDPSILVQLKYSTTDNFVGKDVYGCLSDCYLQKKSG